MEGSGEAALMVPFQGTVRWRVHPRRRAGALALGYCMVAPLGAFEADGFWRTGSLGANPPE